MRSGSEITASAKPMFDRIGEALKVVGAGNGGGMIAMVTALHTITPDHPHTVLLLKPIAVIFAVGVLSFALAYLFMMYAYVYSEHYAALLDQMAKKEPVSERPDSSQGASTAFMKGAMVLSLGSAFCFYVGFVLTFVALIRY